MSRPTLLVGNLVRHASLRQLQVFEAVARLGSFTRAAEASGATQSAVSLKLKRLEAHLERRLIERIIPRPVLPGGTLRCRTHPKCKIAWLSIAIRRIPSILGGNILGKTATSRA